MSIAKNIGRSVFCMSLNSYTSSTKSGFDRGLLKDTAFENLLRRQQYQKIVVNVHANNINY